MPGSLQDAEMENVKGERWFLLQPLPMEYQIWNLSD